MKNPIESFFKMAVFCKIAFSLSAIGLLLSVAGMTSWGAGHKDLLAGLFFYIPLLWVLWFCCALSPKWSLPNFELWLLWWMIDFSILALFASFAMRVDHWAHASGGEIGVLLVYFPAVMPAILLFGVLPSAPISRSFEMLVSLMGGGVGDAFAVWISFSTVALVQSFVIFRFSKRKLTQDL